ncbi:MAG: hypothetical protein WAL97_07520 [Halobacteriota archaeon]
MTWSEPGVTSSAIYPWASVSDAIGEKIETLQTEGKQGRSIDKTKYETIREAVLACFDDGELTHAQLNACVEQKVSGTFQGSIAWYAETVKRDLEARKLMRRMQSATHVTYCIVKNRRHAFRLQARCLAEAALSAVEGIFTIGRTH